MTEKKTYEIPEHLHQKVDEIRHAAKLVNELIDKLAKLENYLLIAKEIYHCMAGGFWQDMEQEQAFYGLTDNLGFDLQATDYVFKDKTELSPADLKDKEAETTLVADVIHSGDLDSQVKASVERVRAEHPSLTSEDSKELASALKGLIINGGGSFVKKVAGGKIQLKVAALTGIESKDPEGVN